LIAYDNQHWMPKFLLKNFVDKDGRVFRFNVADDTVTKPPPKLAASSPNFNELLVNGDPKSFEDEFERLETAAAPVIATIIKNRSLAEIEPLHRAALARFIAAQTFRTEAYRLGLAGLGRRHDVGAVTALHLADLDPLAGLIAQRRWALMVTTDEAPFYLGDNPVVLQRTEDPGRPGEIGLDMKGIEAFMPLSPHCALYMPCPATGSDIVNGFWSALQIVLADLATADGRSSAFDGALPFARNLLGNAGPLYRALVLGEPLVADPANVENLNYLQCAWSSSGIYSNRKDFMFALRVFCENPSYREPMPVSIRQIKNVGTFQS
jgi:hypothetical protein